jgi:hypothetical protein
MGNITNGELAESMRLGFAPWLALWLDQQNLAIGAEEQRMLRIASRVVSLHARAVKEHLRELLAAADNSGLSVCLLKGAAVEPWVYPGPGFRPMRDIDLLVAEEERGCLEAILRSSGYVQRSECPAAYYEDHHHSMPFWHPRHGLWIEVHKRLYPEVANVFRGQQETFDYDGVVARRLTPLAQILYTVSHWADPFPGSGGLIGLIDLGFLLRLCETLDIQHYPLKPDQREWLQRAFDTAGATLGREAVILPRYPKTRLEEIRCHLLRALASNYVVDGAGYTRWSSSAVIANHWNALMNSKSPALALARIPWWFLFPPGRSDRFHPGLVLQRLSRLWRQER